MQQGNDQSIALVVAITFFVLILVFFIAFTTAQHQKRHLSNLLSLQKTKSDFEKEIMMSQLETQQQTFDEIAQEIHDSIGQKISMAKLFVNTFKVTDLNDIEEKSLQVSELLTDAMTEMRQLGQSINSNILRVNGLDKAIEISLNQLKNTGKFNTSFTKEGVKYLLDEKVEFVLFRMFQEVLNNIIKHSQAAAVDVKLQYYNDKFSMTIKDDGVGFNSTSFLTRDHSFSSGLNNIQRRATLINGKLTINSGSDGTVVLLEIFPPHVG
jgi:two-component system, NarL family, sensor kinase